MGLARGMVLLGPDASARMEGRKEGLAYIRKGRIERLPLSGFPPTSRIRSVGWQIECGERCPANLAKGQTNLRAQFRLAVVGRGLARVVRAGLELAQIHAQGLVLDPNEPLGNALSALTGVPY